MTTVMYHVAGVTRCDRIHPSLTGMLVALALYQTAVAQESEAKWGYVQKCDVLSPSQWMLEYPGCEELNNQSPIDVDCADNASTFVNITFPRTGRLLTTLTNTGTTLKATFEETATEDYTIESDTVGFMEGRNSSSVYRMSFMEFRWRAPGFDKGSEHSINGRYFPVELQMMLFNTRYRNYEEAMESDEAAALMTVSVFFELSNGPNPGLSNFINRLNISRGSQLIPLNEGMNTTATFNPCTLMPDQRCGSLESFYFYRGGLTIPPCNGERNMLVQWVLAGQPSTISWSQLRFLQRAFRSNLDTEEFDDIPQVGRGRPQGCRGARRIWWTGTGRKRLPNCSPSDCETPTTPVPFYECEEEEAPHFMSKATIALIAAVSALVTTIVGLIVLYVVSKRKQESYAFSNPGFGQLHD